MHATHRGAHHQPKMVDSKAVPDQSVLGGHHIRVVILRKMRVQAIAGLAGFSVPDAVLQDDVVVADVEKLAGSEQDARKRLCQKLLPGPAGAVQDQDRIGGAPVGIALLPAQRRVMQAKFRQGLPGAEVEIADTLPAWENPVWRRLPAVPEAAWRIRRFPG